MEKLLKRDYFNKWKQLTSNPGVKRVLSDKVYAAAKASTRRRLDHSRFLKYQKALSLLKQFIPYESSKRTVKKSIGKFSWLVCLHIYLFCHKNQTNK